MAFTVSFNCQSYDCFVIKHHLLRLAEDVNRLTERQQMMDATIKFMWTSFSKYADNSIPTLCFLVLGSFRFLAVTCSIILIMLEKMNKIGLILLVMMILQIVKDYYISAGVESNRLLVQRYKMSRSEEDYKEMVDGMVKLRVDVIIYLCILVVPLSLIHFTNCCACHNYSLWPKFANRNSSLAYVIIFLDWAFTTAFLIYFYTDPARFESRYSNWNMC